MRRRWSGHVVLTVAAAALGFGVVSVARGADSPADLVFVQEVPGDVRKETTATWQRFGERFESRTSCWSDVSVELVREVADGDARYVIAEARIEIQIPTTPERYRESLAHEIAHHVERTCPEFETLRSALRPVLGRGSWYDGSVWAEIPSERFAEAVVELVNGERIRHVDEVEVDQSVVDLIAGWGTGGPVESHS